MKLRYLLGCGFYLLFLQMIHADSAEIQPLKIEGIKDNYTFPAPITVRVTNISQSLVTYGIGIQEREPEKWRDFMTNIDDSEPDRLAFKLRKIGPGETQTLTWEPKLTPKIYGSPKGTYRVYFIWYASPNDHRKFYSAPFKVEE